MNQRLWKLKKQISPACSSLSPAYSKTPEAISSRVSLSGNSMNRRTKQEQSKACLSYALRGGGRPKVKR